MGVSLNSLTASVLLCLSLLYFCCVTGQYSVEWAGEGNDLVVVPHQIIRKDKAILYGIIKLRSSPRNILELHFETPQLTRQTSVVLPAKNLYKFKLFSLGRNNAVFIYSDEKDNGTISKFHGFVVDLMTDKKYNIEIPSDFPSKDFLNFIIYSDKFDFLTNHSSICTKAKVCRVSFDQEGKKIGESVAFPVENNWEEFSITPAHPNSPKGGFFVRQMDSKTGNWKISVLDENGKMKSSFEEPQGARYPASNTHSLFSICGVEVNSRAPVKQVICTQYDLRSGQMTHSSTPIDRRAVDVAVTNMPTGGYIFSTTNCDDSFKCDSFNVTAIAFNGKSVQKGPFPLDLDCSELKTGVAPNSAIAEIGDQMCFSFSCGNKMKQSKFKLYNKCLPKNPFKV